MDCGLDLSRTTSGYSQDQMTHQIRRMLLAGCCLCSSILLVGCASFYHATKADEDACLSISLIISPYVNITPGDTNLVLGYLRGADSPVLKAASVEIEGRSEGRRRERASHNLGGTSEHLCWRNSDTPVALTVVAPQYPPKSNEAELGRIRPLGTRSCSPPSEPRS